MPELFLDSCCALLHNTTVNEERHITRLLRLAGATRCPRLSNLVTHVIVGSSVKFVPPQMPFLRVAKFHAP